MGAVGVGVSGLGVRGGDDPRSRREQALEQAADDHGIGNVGDLHFVEAEQAGFLRQRLGDGCYRILRVGLARRVEALVHLLHEGMEMDAALR